MPRIMRNTSRRSLALALVCALLFVHVAFFVHTHHEPVRHYCALCHVGPMPFVWASANVVEPDFVALTWLRRTPDFHAQHDILLTLNSSRAPPA
ncbi:MAG TPA: hypothetical protein VG675_15655 [Bryobacteraceae bacterium]|nr:hypothetical protein [Bryobacteraceae bacterium]